MDTSTAWLPAATLEVDKESKLLPIFVPMPKKDSISGLAAIEEALLNVKIATYTRSPDRESSAYRQTEVENSITRS